MIYFPLLCKSFRSKWTPGIWGAAWHHPFVYGCAVSKAANDIGELQRGYVSICRRQFDSITQIWFTFFIICTCGIRRTVYNVPILSNTYRSSISFKICPLEGLYGIRRIILAWLVLKFNYAVARTIIEIYPIRIQGSLAVIDIRFVTFSWIEWVRQIIRKWIIKWGPSQRDTHHIWQIGGRNIVCKTAQTWHQSIVTPEGGIAIKLVNLFLGAQGLLCCRCRGVFTRIEFDGEGDVLCGGFHICNRRIDAVTRVCVGLNLYHGSSSTLEASYAQLSPKSTFTIGFCARARSIIRANQILSWYRCDIGNDGRLRATGIGKKCCECSTCAQSISRK